MCGLGIGLRLRGCSPVSAPALYGYGYRVIDRVRDRVRVGGLAIAAHSYSGPNRFQWGRKLEFAQTQVRVRVSASATVCTAVYSIYGKHGSGSRKLQIGLYLQTLLQRLLLHNPSQFRVLSRTLLSFSHFFSFAVRTLYGPAPDAFYQHPTQPTTTICTI